MPGAQGFSCLQVTAGNGICSFLDHAQVISPHQRSGQKMEAIPEFGSRRGNRERRDPVVSETHDELQTSLVEMCCPISFFLFVLFYLFAKPKDVILHFLPEFLPQQICRGKCTYCSVTKHVLEMEKALFKENMTFQWKSNFACCF